MILMHEMLQYSNNEVSSGNSDATMRFGALKNLHIQKIILDLTPFGTLIMRSIILETWFISPFCFKNLAVETCATTLIELETVEIQAISLRFIRNHVVHFCVSINYKVT